MPLEGFDGGTIDQDADLAQVGEVDRHRVGQGIHGKQFAQAAAGVAVDQGPFEIDLYVTVDDRRLCSNVPEVAGSAPYRRRPWSERLDRFFQAILLNHTARDLARFGEQCLAVRRGEIEGDLPGRLCGSRRGGGASGAAN